ncbi:2OG-Fe(II) oxygenase [Xanthomonadaceae bacterium JHOS43]|nr:2OG-Fe(II) oxygenase [Xanthomonadaceae bacterium JHOS43]MCX7562481.1 2OG-Fe(II) oxygenase [Xanthomonadaceae bacterium XH05]
MRSIAFAVGQVARYRRGHFLTLHDDFAEGKHRLAAYVPGLTLDWGADCGGQLQFLDRHGEVEDVFIPGFNVLSVFKVPSLHLVTTVAPHVSHPRLSITGWLRTRSESSG